MRKEDVRIEIENVTTEKRGIFIRYFIDGIDMGTAQKDEEDFKQLSEKHGVENVQQIEDYRRENIYRHIKANTIVEAIKPIEMTLHGRGCADSLLNRNEVGSRYITVKNSRISNEIILTGDYGILPRRYSYKNKKDALEFYSKFKVVGRMIPQYSEDEIVKKESKVTYTEDIVKSKRDKIENSTDLDAQDF